MSGLYLTMAQWLHSAASNPLVVLHALGALLFIPALISLRIDPQVIDFNDSYHDRQVVTILCTACLAVSAPLLIDIAMDIIQNKSVPYLGCRSTATLNVAFVNILILVLLRADSPSSRLIIVTCLCYLIFLDTSISIYVFLDMLTMIFTQKCFVYAIVSFYLFICCLLMSSIDGFQGSTALILLVSTFIAFSAVVVSIGFHWLKQQVRDLTRHKSVRKWIGQMNDKKVYMNVLMLRIVAQIAMFATALFGLGGGALNLLGLVLLMGSSVFFFSFTYFFPARMFRNKLMKTSQTSAFKTQLIKYVSHELRSPLTVISVGIELIERELAAKRLPLEENSRDNLIDIKESCAMSIEILDNMLLYEKIDTKTLRLDCVTMNPLEAIRKILQPYQVVAKRHNVDIALLYVREDFTSTSGALRVDEKRLRVVFDAAFRSAFKRASIPLGNEAAKHVDKASDANDVQMQYDMFNEGLAASDGDEQSDSVLGSKYITWVEEKMKPVPTSTKGYSRSGKLLKKPSASLKSELKVRLSIRDNCFEQLDLVGSSSKMDEYREYRTVQWGMVGGVSRFAAPAPTAQTWVHVEILDSHDDISQHDIDEMNADSLDFTRKGHGDGLGCGYRLWCGRKIVEMHQGSLAVYRKSSEWHVHMCLPLLAEDAQLDEPSCLDYSIMSNVIDKQAGEPDGMVIAPPVEICHPSWSADRVLNVLVVDDSFLVRKMVIKLMKSMGHTCTEADDGDVAVQLLRDNDIDVFDLILMDNQMPRMMGTAACSIIRRELHYKGVILGVTGNATQSDITEFIESGVDDVIVKPLTTEKFNAAIACFKPPTEQPTDATRRSTEDGNPLHHGESVLLPNERKPPMTLVNNFGDSSLV